MNSPSQKKYKAPFAFLCIYFPRSIYGISIIQHYIVLLFTDYYTHYATIYYTMLHNTLYSQLDYDFPSFFLLLLVLRCCCCWEAHSAIPLSPSITPSPPSWQVPIYLSIYRRVSIYLSANGMVVQGV